MKNGRQWQIWWQSFLLAVFLDSPCPLSVIVSVTLATWSRWLQLQASHFCSQCVTTARGQTSHLGAFIFQTHSEVALLISPCSWQRVSWFFSFRWATERGNVSPDIYGHPDPAWSSCSPLSAFPLSFGVWVEQPFECGAPSRTVENAYAPLAFACFFLAEIDTSVQKLRHRIS